MTNPQEVKINCLLKGEVAEQFQKIKASKGLTNNTEVISTLIAEYYAKLLREA